MPHSRLPFAASLTGAMLLAASTLLTGCGMGHIDTTTSAAGFHGKVFGGQQPIGQSTITVWQASTTGYGTAATELAHVTSDDNGTFAFASGAYTCPDPATQVYITAAGGNPSPGNPNPNVLLAAGLGNCSSAQNQFVIINEVTTAATAYALGQFFDTTLGTNSDDSFGTTSGDLGYFTLSNTATIPLLVDLPTGTARPSEAGIAREDARLNTVANILAACVNDADPFPKCTELFNDTPNANSDIPTNTLQAAVSIAHLPGQSVADLFNLPTGTAPFLGLSTQPSDLSLAVAYTTPDFGLAINAALPGGSSSNIDIDSTGRVFFPSDVPGQAGFSYFDPSLGSFGSLQIPGALTTPQYLALDPQNDIYESDLGSGNMAVISADLSFSLAGLVTSDAASSSAIYAPSPGGPAALSETNTAGDSFVLAAFPANTVTVSMTVGPLPAPATGITFVPTSSTPSLFAMTGSTTTPCLLVGFVFDEDNNVYGPPTQIASSTNTGCQSGGIAGFGLASAAIGIASTSNELCISLSLVGECQSVSAFNTPQALALDGAGAGWIANAGSSSVLALTSNGQLYSHPQALPKPYGLAIDGSGNVWVSNAGCVTITTTPCTPGPFTLTELIGAAIPAITPLSAQEFSTFSGSEPQTVRSHPVTSNTLFNRQSAQTSLGTSSKSAASIPWINH